MARIRNIKPGYFKDADLFDAEKATGLPLRVAYAGLWTVADRAGRFKWKPREIKTDVLPYDDVDMAAVLDALVKYGFIFRYRVGGLDYGLIPDFEKHQFINKNEAKSQLPDPPENINAPTENSNSLCDTDTDTDTDGLTQTQTMVVTPAIAVAPSRAPSPRATRWPTDKPVPVEWVQAVRDRFRELGRPPPDFAIEAVKFANHWVAKNGKDGLKLDWKKTFENWCFNARSTEQRSFAERKFDNLVGGAAGAAVVDRQPGQGMESPRDNLVRLAISSKP